MKRQIILTAFLFLVGAYLAAAQTPIRDLSQIRRDTRERNRAIEEYDRRNRARNTLLPSSRNLYPGGGIPGSEVRKYVLAAQAVTEVKVISVSSGDTLLVDDGANKVLVHILGIDAPEKGQTFYEEATKTLRDLVAGKKVVLKYSLHHLKNEFGYFSARVFIGEKNIGLSILESGLAWRNEKDKFFVEKKADEANERAEAKAQAAKIGIWKEEKPQKPWVYRERKKKELEKAKKKTAKN